ncbi:MAG: ribosome recycling factor [candidate division Zixibacteria bacterium]|nr:ribosome recycling factor [candidate division Zixibacteria bacterium]
MIDEILKQTKEKMHKSVEAIHRELATVRTGKASTHLLDTVRVEAYGSVMPLNQVGTVSAPEARLLTIQAFDKTVVGEIVKAIQKADLGLNPQADGTLIRIPIPALNEERRKELVKHCKHLAEEGKVAIRNVRRDANDHLKKALKDHKLAEDAEKEAMEKVQKFTDDFIHQIDDMLAKKEKEMMEV